VSVEGVVDAGSRIQSYHPLIEPPPTGERAMWMVVDGMTAT